MQNSRNARNTFKKFSFLEMIINIFCLLENRKLLLPFQSSKDFNEFSITIFKGHFWQQTLQKLCTLNFFYRQLFMIFKWKIT